MRYPGPFSRATQGHQACAGCKHDSQMQQVLLHPWIQPLQASWEFDTQSWGLSHHSVSSHKVPTLSSFLSLCLICLSRLPPGQLHPAQIFLIRRISPPVSSVSQQAMTSTARQPLEWEFFPSLPTCLQMGQMDGWVAMSGESLSLLPGH